MRVEGRTLKIIQNASYQSRRYLENDGGWLEYDVCYTHFVRFVKLLPMHIVAELFTVIGRQILGWNYGEVLVLDWGAKVLEGRNSNVAYQRPNSLDNEGWIKELLRICPQSKPQNGSYGRVQIFTSGA